MNLNTYSLILLRGLPGSGKTTLAKLLSENNKYPIFSVDDYFTDFETGVYEFKFEENYLAYKACEENTEYALSKMINKVIIHNTFTMDWELEPYFKLAKKHDYQLFIVTVENYHNNANLHNVSTVQLKKMAQKYRVKLL